MSGQAQAESFKDTPVQAAPPFVRWVAAREVWFLAPAGAALLFPNGWYPLAALVWIGGLWICRRLATGRWSVNSGVGLPVFLLGIFTVLGYSISVVPEMSATRAWGMVLGAAVFFAAVNQAGWPGQRWLLVAALALGAVAMALVGLFGADWSAVRLVDLPWLYPHLPVLIRNLPGSGVVWQSDLINPRLVGLTIGALLPLFLALSFFARGRGLRILAAGVVLVGSVVLVLSQALQGLAGVLVAFWLLLIWRNRWWLLALPAGLLALGCVIIWLTPAGLAAFLLSIDNPVGIAVALRLDMWGTAVRMLRDMPFTGIGLNTYPVMQSQFYAGHLLGPNEPHAHNLVLQTALDFGIPGLMAFFWLLVAWGRRVYQNYRMAQDWNTRVLLVGGLTSVASYLVGGLADVMTLGAKPAVALWLLMAVCIAAPDVEARGKKLRGREILPGSAPLLALFVVVAAVAILFPSRWQMNRGAILAHRVLYSFRQDLFLSSDSAALIRAVDLLERGSHSGWENAGLSALIGELYAWQGQYDRSVGAYQHQMALDLANPDGQYYWPDAILQWFGVLPASPPAERLLKIYQNWSIRYPQRASYYLLASMVCDTQLEDHKQAGNWLSAGVLADSRPLLLLAYQQGH